MDKTRNIEHPEEWDSSLKLLAKKKHTSVKGLFTLTMEKELMKEGYLQKHN